MKGHAMYVEPARARDTRRVIRRLIRYFAPYKGRLVLIAVLLLAGTLSDLLAPYLIGVAVDQFIRSGTRPQPAWLTFLLPAQANRPTGLSVVMGLLAMVYVTSWGLNVVQFRSMVRIAQGVLLKMRTQILDKLHTLDIGFFDRHEAGDLMSRLTNDTQVINDMFGPGLMRILRMTLSLLGIIASMFLLNWRLALASYMVLPVIVLVVAFFSKHIRRAFRQTRKTIGEVSAELQENIAGIREVQAFARESETIREFRTINARNLTANVRAETLSAIFLPLLDVLSTTATAIVIGFGGYLVLAFDPPLVSIGVIVAFLTYVRRFYQPIRELANLYAQLQASIAGAERIFELLDTPPAIQDSSDAIELEEIEGRVDYDHVSFTYDGQNWVLKDVTVHIKPGEVFALVGPTGAGKTTFANLLLRFYDATSGEVRVDGYNVRSVTQASLRRHIAVVPQDTFLFATSVMENIRYGRLDATDQEVIEAARMANAHEFIERLPEGYQTKLGERGTTLSQGHRQLLAIARAILKSPRILILDEATSSVDTRTERLIQDGLAHLMKGRTSLVIAHRLSTIRHADQILVIKDGRIVERGRHQELLERQGVYHELYMSQFRRLKDLESAIATPIADGSSD